MPQFLITTLLEGIIEGNNPAFKTILCPCSPVANCMNPAPNPVKVSLEINNISRQNG